MFNNNICLIVLTNGSIKKRCYTQPAPFFSKSQILNELELIFWWLLLMVVIPAMQMCEKKFTHVNVFFCKDTCI